MPILVVIAGANGSGKTTLTKRIRETHKRSENFPIVNPDESKFDSPTYVHWRI